MHDSISCPQFLYQYISNVGVRKATITCEDVDFSDATALCSDDPILREERSGDEEEQHFEAEFAGTSKTEDIRQSKISFEADPTFLMAVELGEAGVVPLGTNERNGSSGHLGRVGDEKALSAKIDEVPAAAKSDLSEASEAEDCDSEPEFCRVNITEKGAPLRCSKELFEENPRLMLSVLLDDDVGILLDEDGILVEEV